MLFDYKQSILCSSTSRTQSKANLKMIKKYSIYSILFQTTSYSNTRLGRHILKGVWMTTSTPTLHRPAFKLLLKKDREGAAALSTPHPHYTLRSLLSLQGDISMTTMEQENANEHPC